MADKTSPDLQVLHHNRCLVIAQGVTMPDTPQSLTELFEYPLFQAIFGQSCRFGSGMTIPSGPLACSGGTKRKPVLTASHRLCIQYADLNSQ